jgi:hypothetical protein
MQRIITPQHIKLHPKHLAKIKLFNNPEKNLPLFTFLFLLTCGIPEYYNAVNNRYK